MKYELLNCGGIVPGIIKGAITKTSEAVQVIAEVSIANDLKSIYNNWNQQKNKSD